jgi:hypothetical protein
MFMKKIVLVLAVLMLAVPVMANIRIDANQVGSSPVVEVKYTRTGGDDVNLPRAFALDVNMSPANGTTLAPYDLNPNFYVAPGTFTYDPCTGATYWGNRVVGPNTVIFTLEMGSLYATNDPCGHTTPPASSGVLCRFTVDKDCNIGLAQNAIRGGVVMESTTVAFPPEYVELYGTYVSLQTPPLAPSQILYQTYDTDCNIPCYWSVSSGATSYELEKSDNGAGGPWANVYTGALTYKMNTVAVGLHRFRVRACNSVGCSDYRTGATDANSTLSTCYRGGNTADPNWASWVAVGRPDCWCGTPKGSVYQCDGDADGAKYGSYRIYSVDLNMLVNTWKKTAAQLAADPNVSGTTLKINYSACADTDHKAYGSYRVYQVELNKLTSQWKWPDANFPGNCPR